MVIPNGSSLAAIQRGPFRSKELPVSQAICARRDPLRAQRLICCRTCPSQMRMQVPLCSGCLAVLSELCAYLSAVIPSITVVLGRRKQRQLHQVLARPISYLAFLFFCPDQASKRILVTQVMRELLRGCGWWLAGRTQPCTLAVVHGRARDLGGSEKGCWYLGTASAY